MLVKRNNSSIARAVHVNRNLHCAYSVGLGFIHYSGDGYTTDRNQAWTGNVSQFRNLCERFGHDAKKFTLFHILELTALLTAGNN